MMADVKAAQDDVQYVANVALGDTQTTPSAAAQPNPPKTQRNALCRTDKVKAAAPAGKDDTDVRANKLNSNCCCVSITCRLVKERSEHNPVDATEPQPWCDTLPEQQEQRSSVAWAACCSKLSSYRKVKLKSTPLQTNHRKNIKSKGSGGGGGGLYSLLRHVITVNKSLLSAAIQGPAASISQPKTTVSAGRRGKFTLLPSLGTTSFITLLTIICLETVLLSTMSTCAKTFYMHWNTSNSIFRIDNTDHIIDVNKGNLAFEFDQVHIICPVYEPGTYENETEKYIIYNVSKVEYETCRITNADPRVIAICDKPHKLMFFTITFRPFTPQPGGLEFLPGNDYYFISTSSKDDLYRRIGGRCSTNNMKVVFKVCCAPEEKNRTIAGSGGGGKNSAGGGDSIGNTVTTSSEVMNIDMTAQTNGNKQIVNNIHSNGINTALMPGSGININSATNNGIQLNPLNVGGNAINTNVEQFNRIPMQTNGINVLGNGAGIGSHGGNGILLTPGHGGINMIPGGAVGIGQFPGLHGQSGIRINNVPPPQQHYPTHKSNNDDLHHYDKHPNEVVKNEELTYNSASPTLHQQWRLPLKIIAALNTKQYLRQNIEYVNLSFNPLVLLPLCLLVLAQCVYGNAQSITSSARNSTAALQRSYSTATRSAWPSLTQQCSAATGEQR